MIERIVKMVFRSDAIEDFQQIFEDHKSGIRNRPGCLGLSLLQDINDPRIFFTHSMWNSEEDLNAYRHSDTFAIVWPKTKALFDGKPEAWSVAVKVDLRDAENSVH